MSGDLRRATGSSAPRARPTDPPGPYVVTELSIGGLTADQCDPDRLAGAPHPETTPVGPFPDRAAADAWAFDYIRSFGGSGSWSIAPLRSPA